ncbi:MAG: formylglycine-generating enzyme family protein [Paracoccaceae bacterium]
MIAAIAYPTGFYRTTRGVLAVGTIAAVIALGAIALRAPDHTLLPVMAERPVALKDGRVLYVQRHEVTIAEWNICAAARACTLELRTRHNQDPVTTPATGLSYVDVQEYVAWINRKTGHDFRLPTAAEWDTMAAAVLPEKPAPIFTDPALAWASGYLTTGRAPRALKPQGSFSTSPEGVADLDGSVWEWTQDCYAGTAEDPDPARCAAFVLGGEHVAVMPFLTRDPANGGCAVGVPPAHLGMRLVSDAAT